MTDRNDDPGANTEMFQAYVERGRRPDAPPRASNRTPVIVGAALVVLVVVLLLVLMG